VYAFADSNIDNIASTDSGNIVLVLVLSIVTKTLLNAGNKSRCFLLSNIPPLDMLELSSSSSHDADGRVEIGCETVSCRGRFMAMVVDE
jgi:hypothetical protein